MLSQNYCIFEDLTLGKMIGSAKEGNDLYYLDIEERGKVRAYQIKETIEEFFLKAIG